MNGLGLQNYQIFSHRASRSWDGSVKCSDTIFTLQVSSDGAHVCVFLLRDTGEIVAHPASKRVPWH